MQKPESVSLNALRVFLTASRHLSIRKAADELAVTPGAVSHQIKSLEQSLNVKLFERSNNAIKLTEAGKQLVRKSTPGLQILHNAIDGVMGGGDKIRVRASMSFAMRWLIPRLHHFKSKYPDIVVEVETFFNTDHSPAGNADLTIAYFRYDERPDDGSVLIEDTCRAYLAPELLTGLADVNDITAVPAIQCSKGNWDWQLWLSEMGRPDAKLKFAERFDLDDAALRAACGSIGMVLASEALIEQDIQNGRLLPLPNSARINAGCYAIEITSMETGAVRKFVRWLREGAERSP